ncbi:MAG TPA: FKBP-type peptidyl-prolyl cis-trans isomerase, partial [Saprospiraceae bacterium]|nr:FKBP-type peptidyl-prolyl cis-trans isomerase [Saprospiraceae bacterium]
PQGVYIKIDNEGSAQKPNPGSTVTIHYRGTLTNGKQFDSSYDRGAPATFALGTLIQGWQIGIPYFGRGGKGTLIVPPNLGYGSRAQGDIPANSILVFDIELINFQ